MEGEGTGLHLVGPIEATGVEDHPVYLFRKEVRRSREKGQRKFRLGSACCRKGEIRCDLGRGGEVAGVGGGE